MAALVTNELKNINVPGWAMSAPEYCDTFPVGLGAALEVEVLLAIVSFL